MAFNQTESNKRLELVLKYQRENNLEAREELVESMQPLINSCTSNLKYHLPKHVDSDELISDCYFGLLDAIEKYDPSKGKFESYAFLRMRGEAVEGIRKRNPLSRTIGLFSDFEALSHSGLSYEEIVEKTGLSKQTFENAFFGFKMQHAYSISEISQDGFKFEDIYYDKKADFLEMLMLKDEIVTLMEDMPLRYKQILELRIMGCTSTEIANKFGVTPGRISQINRETKKYLMKYIDLAA